jgi:multiple sugar transport system ATP-binding protein
MGTGKVAAVTFAHVSKRFDDGTVAVKDLCLEIKDAEFMVLVGPSGCGKTTALRMLAGLDAVSEGELRIGGEVVNDVPTRNREIAMVFQSYALYPHLSVFENLAFGLRMQGTARIEIETQVHAVARTLALDRLLTRKPRELSGGEQQRVALGRALVREPRCVLLDEPLSSLDAKLRAQMRVELQRIHRALRATFLYVTHDQVEAMTMGDRIAVMKDGELQQVGPPRQVYDQPASLFVAGFIGSPSMNLIPVTVDRRTARASGFEIDLPLAPRVDRGILGIRPEALTDRIRDHQPSIDARVEITEVLGSDQFVHASVGGDAIIARLDPKLRVSRGDRLRLAVDPHRLHLFEAGTGRAIL